MKCNPLVLVAVCGLAGSLAANTLPAQPNVARKAEETFHPTRILAKYKAGERAGPANAVLKQHGLKAHRQFRLLPQVVVLDLEDEAQIKAGKALPPQARAKGLRDRIAALQATGRFEYVEPDYIRTLAAEPTDGAFVEGTLWALKNTGQNGGVPGADIGAVAAWGLTTGSTNVIVAVVDTGIRYTHQDLAANLWRNPGEIPDNGIDDDEDGYVDNMHGINAIAGTGDPMDDNGHGTHVAGTIGASANDGHPHVGVAWNVRLLACKAFDSEGGSASQEAYVSDTIECIAFAVSKGARIINASYGAPAYSRTEFEAIRAARDQGVLFVASAGNDRNGQNNDTSWLRSYPASHALENVISVAALDRSDNLASFSHFGPNSVHLGAPGVDIYSCVNNSDSAYGALQGTSMATPHAVGAAALILAEHPAASVVELRRRILNGVVPIPSLTNKTVTGGRLNVFNSLVDVPSGEMTVEVFPRTGQTLPSGRTALLSVTVTDLLPVTNATVTANLDGFVTLVLATDTAAGAGIYTNSFLVPTNQSSLSVSVVASATGWENVTNDVFYPVILPPPNDNFADRIAIPAGLCPVSVTGQNGNASKEPGEPYHGTGLGGRSLWWSWTAPFTGPVKMSTADSWVITALAVYTGSVLTNLSCVASNDHPSKYDWYSALTFEAEAGVEYQIAVDGIGPDAGQIVLGLLPLAASATLAEALDDPALVWTSAGQAPWIGQNCVTYDGTDAARSGALEANGQSWLETVVPGPGTLTFRWKVSSEGGYDYLRFSINATEQARISGEVNWQQKTYALEPGIHTLRWVYTKDYMVSSGQDAGWLDDVAVAYTSSRFAVPARFGDLDGDGQPTVLDLTLLTGFLADSNGLAPQVAVFADVNGDALINSEDINALANAILGRSALRVPVDTDGDGIPDVLEALLNLDANELDSNGNGIPDGQEDFDYDGLSNALELRFGTDPLRNDTDGDGWLDEAELTTGSNPFDAASRPFLMVVSTPPASVVLPAFVPESLINATVIAMPPVSLVLPAHDGTGGLADNTVVAQPPVSVVLPAAVMENVTNATIIANPPVALVLPANEGVGGLTNNTVIAMPPVRIEWESP
jgi:subtilisin family serine protease